MCQVHLANRGPERLGCGGGYLAGLGNYIPHRKDCPLIASNKTKRENPEVARTDPPRKKHD